MSNEAFHCLYPRLQVNLKNVTKKELLVAELEARLAPARAELETAKAELEVTQSEFTELQPRLSFSLPTSVLLSILGLVGKKAGVRAACVKREWRDEVETATATGMYRGKVLSVATGSLAISQSQTESGFTVFVTVKGVYSCGSRITAAAEELAMPELGHGHHSRSELLPRLIEALSGKKVIGASAHSAHTAVWTESGELFTFGDGVNGKLGHGGEQSELVPRLVEGLAGTKVVGASAGGSHTVVWTDTGELFIFGTCTGGKLCYGGPTNELVDLPRRVEGLAGKKVMGAAAGYQHTAVWTDAGDLFTFGDGWSRALGHGRLGNQPHPPSLVVALAGKKVIGAAAGTFHTAVWTKEGELFTFGLGDGGKLGHGGTHEEHVPRLVDALAGKKVVGATACKMHTAVWMETGELFTFGAGQFGQLGHGDKADEYAPRLVEALAGHEVIGASASAEHTVAWTEEGGFAFGAGSRGELGDVIVHPIDGLRVEAERYLPKCRSGT